MVIIKSCREVKNLQGLHLYHCGSSINSQKVRLVLKHKGLFWVDHHIDLQSGEHLTQWFFKINPAGILPVLVHHGKTIAESSDIIWYLESHFPDHPLLNVEQNLKDEVKSLLTKCDDMNDSLCCISCEFLFGMFGRRSISQLERMRSLTSNRQTYEIHMSHHDGFERGNIKQHIQKLHRCFDELNGKLNNDCPWLVGGCLSLADYSWVVVVHRAIACGFPIERYPKLITWYLNIKESSVFKEAVLNYETLSYRLLTVKVWLYDQLGQGIVGYEQELETMWHIPVICFIVLLIVCLFCPISGIHLLIPVSRSLLLSSLLCVTISAFMMAWLQAHQPSLQSDRPEVRPQEYMRAAVIVDYGGLEVVKQSIRQMKPKLCNPKEVLVEVKAASLNPVDIQTCTGRGHHWLNHCRKKQGLKGGNGTEFPFTLGQDFSGVVAYVGTEVTSVKTGDNVFGFVELHEQGTFAQYVLTKESHVCKKPENLSFEEATSVVYVGLSALSALVEEAALSPDNCNRKRVLIQGASGGIGTFAVQLVKCWGGNVTAICSTDGIEIMKKLGADDIIDYKEGNIADMLRQMERFDIILTLHPLTFEAQITSKHLKPEGVLIVMENPFLQYTSTYGIHVGSLINWLACLKFKMTQKIYYGLHVKIPSCFPSAENIEVIYKLLEEEKVKPVIEKIYSFSEIHKALKHVNQCHTKGKCVIKI